MIKELRQSEFEGLDSYFKNEYNKVYIKGSFGDDKKLIHYLHQFLLQSIKKPHEFIEI